MSAGIFFTCLLNTAIEGQNLNGIGKLFHNQLPNTSLPIRSSCVK